MRTLRWALALATALLVSGGSGVGMALAADSATTSAPTSATTGAARPGRYEIDSSHTGVYFAATHFERTLVRGRFLGIKGQLDFDAANRSGSIDLEIDPDRVDTGLRGLDAVLRSSQFFDTKEYPQVRFQSTRFEFLGEQLQLVHGMLTLHGVTLPVQLKAERFSCGDVKIVFIRRYVCGGEFRAQISRSSFGMKQFIPDVGDTVWLEIAIEASPAS